MDAVDHMVLGILCSTRQPHQTLPRIWNIWQKNIFRCVLNDRLCSELLPGFSQGFKHKLKREHHNGKLTFTVTALLLNENLWKSDHIVQCKHTRRVAPKIKKSDFQDNSHNDLWNKFHMVILEATLETRKIGQWSFE